MCFIDLVSFQINFLATVLLFYPGQPGQHKTHVCTKAYLYSNGHSIDSCCLELSQLPCLCWSWVHFQCDFSFFIHMTHFLNGLNDFLWVARNYFGLYVRTFHICTMAYICVMWIVWMFALLTSQKVSVLFNYLHEPGVAVQGRESHHQSTQRWPWWYKSDVCCTVTPLPVTTQVY